MKLLKIIIIILLINILSINNVFASPIDNLDISSTHIVLYNLEDNTVLLDVKKDEKTSIASLTKIMTCLIAIEKIEDMNAKVTINYNMIKGLIEANAYVIGLRRGQVLTYKDLLYATFLESAADAARGLALSLASSEEEYVKWMNEKAVELDLPLHFANVIGLDDPENYGTVDGVAKLLMIALENETFKELFLTENYVLSDNSRKCTNSMRYSAKVYHLDISYIEGGKIGLTDDAGKCLASTAYDSKNNIRYLLVTTGASTSKTNAYHVLDATKIYKYYFDNYKYYDVLKENDKLLTFNIKHSNKTIDILNKENIKYYSDNTFDTNKITIKYDGETDISPFIDKNKPLGKLSIYYEAELLKEEDLTSDILDFNILTKVQKDMGLILLISMLGIMGVLIIIKIVIRHIA